MQKTIRTHHSPEPILRAFGNLPEREEVEEDDEDGVGREKEGAAFGERSSCAVVIAASS